MFGAGRMEDWRLGIEGRREAKGGRNVLIGGSGRNSGWGIWIHSVDGCVRVNVGVWECGCMYVCECECECEDGLGSN